MEEGKRLTFAPIIREKDRLLRYLESIHDLRGRPSMMTHRRLLKENDPEAKFCESILSIYDLSAFWLEYIIRENFEGFHLYCVVCGKRLKERNIVTRYKTCSHKCGSVIGSTKKSLTMAKKHDERQEIREANFTKYKKENYIGDSLDLNMTSIRKNAKALREYLKELGDCNGNPNSSPHNSRVINSDPIAVLADCILMEYGITLKELKYILANNFENVTFYCKTCGKRLTNVARQFCSVDCEMNNSEIFEARRKACLEKYGVEHHIQRKDVQAKIKGIIVERYGSPEEFYRMIQEKIRRTNAERYGYSNILKSDGGMSAITEARKASLRIKSYDVLIEFLAERNLKVITSKEEYAKKNLLELECDKCHSRFFTDKTWNLRYSIFCDKCHKNYRYTREDDLFYFIQSILPNCEVSRRCRTLISGYEIDIYVPERKIAFEFDGTYWHSSNFRATERLYHVTKTELCEEKGIHLLHIFEHEWFFKRNIVKAIIKSQLGLYSKKIYARKCEVKELTVSEYREFLDQNHLQGYCHSAIRYGLFCKDELVACIGFNKSRFKDGEIELVRFCVKMDYQVVGGFSKLIKHSRIQEFISYVDRRYFTGKGYKAIEGMELIGVSQPSYIYVKDDEVLSRYQCQKHLLPKLLGDHFDSEKSEVENMSAARYYQLFDCGMLKFRYSVK